MSNRLRFCLQDAPPGDAPVGHAELPQQVDLWQHLGLHVRLALSPNDPRVLTAYLTQGLALIDAHGQEPWGVHERSLSLLLDTANDAFLPMVWRIACLDVCCWPLGQLRPLADSEARAARLRELAWRLANVSLHPTHADSR